MDSPLAYITQHVRTAQLGAGAETHLFRIVGFPGIEVTCLQHHDEISERVISLNGEIYATIDDAARAWRLKRQRAPVYDVVGNALRSILLGDEDRPWDELSPSKRESWVIGAETFCAKLETLGLTITPKGD